MTTFTTPPDAPSRNDPPATFISKANAFLAWLVAFALELIDFVASLSLISTTGSSATSNSISTGAKTFTADTGKSWSPGMFIVIADTAEPSTNSMLAQVTSYDSGTGALVVDVKSTLGSGTKTAWTISQTANPVPLDGSVATASIQDSAVTTAKLANNAVTNAKLSTDAITGATEDTSPDAAADYLLSYDASAGALKKVLMGLAAGWTYLAEQATTSGTSWDFTGIPSWATEIDVFFVGFSTNGTSIPMIQIGDSGGIEATGYLGAGSVIASSSGTTANGTTGFLIAGAWAAGATAHAKFNISLEDSSDNTWICSGVGGFSDNNQTIWGGGSKALSATLDRVRVTTVGGVNTGDAGVVRVRYR